MNVSKINNRPVMKKNSIRGIGLSLLLMAVSLSCSNDKKKSGDSSSTSEKIGIKENPKNLPNSVGKTSELLVVMNEGLWEASSGDTVRDFFGQQVPRLPQVEPMFTTPNVNLSALNKRMFKNHRNLFIVDIDESRYNRPYIETKEDLWSFPQRVIRINSPHLKGFYRLFEEHQQAFLRLFHENEIRRLQITFSQAASIEIRNMLMENYDVSMVFPDGFFIAKQLKNFAWIRKETRKYGQGLMLRVEPYKDTSQFTTQAILSRRNTITRSFIPGPTEGSYMITSDVIPPKVERTTFKEQFAVKIRGLWELENGFLGGPYMSYTFVNENNGKLYTLDSYVYAPGQDKRDKLLQMEAIMKSLRFTGD